MEKQKGTQLRIASLQPNETRKLSITGEQTNRSVDQLAVEIKESENKLGELKLNFPKKNLHQLALPHHLYKNLPHNKNHRYPVNQSKSQPKKQRQKENRLCKQKKHKQKNHSQQVKKQRTSILDYLRQLCLKALELRQHQDEASINQSIIACTKASFFSTGNTNLKILDEKEYRANIFLNTKAPSSGYAINNFVLEFADVDGDPTTYNSSRAYIDLDGAKEIAWAGLFWSSSRYKGPAFGTNLSDEEISAPVKFTTPNGTSQRVAPQYCHRIDQDKTDPGQYFGYNNTGFSNYADVTSIIQGDGSGTGGYTLADIPMTKP